MKDATHAQLAGARILAEANDLKRDSYALAAELSLDHASIDDVLAGRATPELTDEVIRRMGDVYPIDEADLRLLHDDCDAGVKIMRAKESRATSRIFRRPDRDGNLEPYYEYRDTAFSRLSPFRPEWIRELRVVSDCDPRNPDVAFNHGHFLHQYSMYVGPVNHYWEIDGRRYAAEMRTGDSSYTTPFRPHTFTSRSATERALILAVTFGGDVRRAQRELYTLGTRAGQYLLDQTTATAATKSLVRQYLRDSALSLEQLDTRLRRAGATLSARDAVDGDVPLGTQELGHLATVLGVSVRDLHVPVFDDTEDVIIGHTHDDQGYAYPAPGAHRCTIRPMVHTARMPAMRGFTARPVSTDLDLDGGFTTSLHSWIYNYSDYPARLRWSDGVVERDTVIEPDDSLYVQPFVAHSVARVDAEPAELCVVRVAGHVSGDTQRELSRFPAIGRVVREDRRWF
jgi:methylphosphonate synthase